MKIVRLVWDGACIRFLDKAIADPMYGYTNGRLICDQGSFEPFDAVEVTDAVEVGATPYELHCIETIDGLTYYREIKPKEAQEMADQEIPASPAPVQYEPLSISLTVAENVRGDLKCMDLFNQLLKSEPFQDCARQKEHHNGLIHWMKESLRNMEQ